MNPIETFATYLIENSAVISSEIVDYNLSKLEVEVPADLVEKSKKVNSEFFALLGKSLHESDEDAIAEFIYWHKKQAQEQNEINARFRDISSLVKPYADTRLRLIEMVTKISIKEGLSTEEVVFVNNRISYLLDLSITETIIERERLAAELHQKQTKLITELSSPIVPIQNGMAILPLIGEFDFDRSNYILTHVIPRVSEMRIECLIIDFSGIASIDTEVSERIFKVYEVLALLGIGAMFTGIRPDLASMIVTAGIDFSKLKTFSTVQQAILSPH